MRTRPSIVKDCPQSLTRRALLAAIGLTAVTLVSLQPVSAQPDGEFSPGMETQHYGTPISPDTADPWNTIPPSLADPALAPAPNEPFEPPLTQMPPQFVPGLPGAFIEPWNDPAIPAPRPMVVSPPPNSMEMDRPDGLRFPVR
jgi:hypothetical protein